jgi:hypothetical protein
MKSMQILSRMAIAKSKTATMESAMKKDGQSRPLPYLGFHQPA